MHTRLAVKLRDVLDISP